MAQSRVVIVSNDDWIAQLIVVTLQEGGTDALVRGSAEEALALVEASSIDAVVCDAVLPDHDAAWLVAKIRQGRHPLTPFVLLAHADDSFSRVDALQAGADACLTKPFKVDEVCLQLQALIAMARRFSELRRVSERPRATSAPPSRVASEEAFAGDIAQMSLSTVLTLLELERRTGVLTVKGARQSATVMMQGGAATKATLGGAHVAPIAALRRVLKWKTGHFTFRVGDSVAPPEDLCSIGALLLEVARLDDEAPASSSLLELSPTPAPALDVTFEDLEAPTAKTAEPTGKRPGRRSTRPPPISGSAAVDAELHARKTRPAPPMPSKQGKPSAPVLPSANTERRAMRPPPPVGGGGVAPVAGAGGGLGVSVPTPAPALPPRPRPSAPKPPLPGRQGG